ncbi:MAG: right-handed parallel beta-helix repeat-containing protein, partial [Anaerolineae bacterium]|nr:right-handed parallel beta-helix repeat-containing protein [Anaerolineae bacterium]
MNKTSVRWTRIVILPLMAILIAASGRLPARADTGGPAEMLQHAWRNVQDAGSYRFISDVDQTLVPRPVPEMIGQQETALSLALDGAVVLPDRAYMDLRLAGAGHDGSVGMLRDGGQSFTIQDGELKPVDDALNLTLSTDSVLSYLAAAENVVLLSPPDGHPELVRYGFDVDGPRFAEVMRQRAEAQLQAEPGAPEGLTIKPAPALQRISGHGELWVNARGLPVRQVIDLEMPEVNAQYDARLHMVANLSSYGQVESLPRAVQGPDGTWHLEGSVMGAGEDTAALGPAMTSSSQASKASEIDASAGWRSRLAGESPLHVPSTAVTLVLVFAAALLFIRLYRRHPRRAYTLVVFLLVPLMVLSPILQSGSVLAFTERQAKAAEERQAAVPEMLSALGLETEDAQPAAEPAVTAPDAATDARAGSAQAAVGSGLALNVGGELAVQATSLLEANGDTSAFARCGDVDSGVDTDGDGLDDAVELCLGTSRYSTDTDHDGIPDNAEVTGFDCAGKHWESDPLKPDSNDDGAMDTLEWPSTELAPDGQAATCDLDNDRVPNLWDDDDDGDGVPDVQDISPFAVTGYTTVANLSTEGSGFSGYETIQIQVQPEEQEHLRYSTTGLDWPQDTKGNIREYDDWNSHEDVRLSPYLIVTTNVAPDAPGTTTLGDKYGFRSWVEGDHVILLAPLLPVQSGGAISTFLAKVAYVPSQLDDIQWQAEMVWMAQVDNDSPDPQYAVHTETTMAHEYQDSFRITGLEVTKEGGNEAAVFGTPEKFDDLDLFRVLLGLNDTFRTHVKMEDQASDETALQEIASRFGSGSTATITHTFGVSPDLVDVRRRPTYGLQDAGLAGIGSDLVPSILEDPQNQQFYYNERCQDADGTRVNCASLIVAYETSVGARDLSDFPSTASGTIDLGQLHVNLADVPLLTTRGVQMHMYEERSDGWQITTPARMLELMEQRYRSTYDTALRDLYPGLETDHLRFMTYAAYLWATTNSYKAVSVDGEALVDELANETQLAIDRALDPTAEAESTTAVNYWAMGTGIAGVIFSGIVSYAGWTVGDFTKFMREHAGDTSFTLSSAWDFFGVGLSVFCVGAALIMGIIGAICSADSDLAICRNALALDIANGVVQGLNILSNVLQMIEVIQKAIEGTLKAATTIAMTVAAVGAIVSIAASWVGWILTCVYGGLSNPVVWRNALANAIMSTIWAIVMLVISCIPVIGQIIAAIMAVLDGLFALFTWLFGGNAQTISQALLSLFYLAEVCTNIGDDSITFGDFTSGLTDPDMGMVGGNTFLLRAPFEGALIETSFGNDDDLAKSSVEGHLSGEYAYYDEDELAAIFPSEDMSEQPTCTTSSIVKYCSNNTEIGYLLTPKINGIVPMQALVNYTIVWAEFGGAGAWRYSTHTLDGVAPEEIDYLKPDFTYLDILPVSLTDLWNWSELTNHDWDGDGLWDEQETALGTSRTAWDTDGDGLSDQYEWQTAGTDPRKPDTDGDGLNDRLELRLGTFVGVADSDGDGLTDGEEVRRYANGAMVGGWKITLSDGNAYWVSSDPLDADTDGDGLNDAEEKANLLSPNATNQLVPSLSMKVTPVRGVPGGRAGAYWLPNEDVTIDIRLSNGSPSAVTTTLTLDLPSWLEALQGGVMQGDGTASLTRTPGKLSWSFSGADALQSYETVTTTITARTSTTVSGSSEVALSLPFGTIQMRKTFDAVLDGDNPDVAIMAPAAGSYLSGAGTTYVVGGLATDPTTWITTTELSIVALGSPDSYQALPTTSSPWASNWTLPSDGIYVLRARATDVMNHVSTTAPVTVTVDSTPPSATLTCNMVDGTAHLNGTADDALAGVRSVQLSIDKQPWHSVPVSGTTWSYDWTVGEGAQGEHEVVAFSVDRSGNRSPIVTATITVDSVAPSSIVNAGADADVPPAVMPNTSFNITGVADEGGHLPLPSAPANLRSGMDVLDDSTVWLGLSSIQQNDGGIVATWIGDFNADRLSDLAVGLPGPAGDAGQVAILYGRAGGWPTQPDLEMLAHSTTHFIGTAGARLGSYVSAAGDVNGDTYADLLIGERASTRAFLIYGRPGPMGNVTLEAGQTAHRTLLQAPGNIEALASAGDVNGDGYADFFVTVNACPYLILGRKDPWLETIDVQAEAVASFGGAGRALGVGDVDGDQLAEWVTVKTFEIRLYGWDTTNNQPPSFSSGQIFSANSPTRAAALGDVNRDGYADWLYTDYGGPTLVYGRYNTPYATPYATYRFSSSYSGFLAAPGDVDGDRRADILLSDASGVASLFRQAEGAAYPTLLATIAGVGGAANAPYAAGADVNSDGSADLLLIPSQAAAEAHGFDAPDFSSGFISPQSLPLGVSTVSPASNGTAPAPMSALSMLGIAPLLANVAETRYVDDDAVANVCDGHSPCFTSIQAAVTATDGGSDTIIVYPGVYPAFTVPAGTAYDKLTIRGVSPDAVFVEGSSTQDAIQVYADGVHLSNLTVRNARAGIALQDGAGEAPTGSGNETVIDHVVAHSVSYPISMTQTTALSITDSTLVGNGTNEIVYVNPAAGGLYEWNADQTVPASINDEGALVRAGSSLYALPGGGVSRIYQATPAVDGTLGAWSQPFSLTHALPTNTGTTPSQQGTSLLVGSATMLSQLHSNFTWPILGGEAIGQILALAIDPATGDVYAAGSFTKIKIGATEQEFFHIARWDATNMSWNALGTGTNGTVHALAFDNDGNLWVGGEFTRAGNLDASRVARWNGSAWSVVGLDGKYDESTYYNGVNGPVYALQNVPGDKRMYIGGAFTRATEWGNGGATVWTPASNLAVWKTDCSPGPSTTCFGGSTQTPTNGVVTALSFGGLTVYAGGNFTAVGSGFSTTAQHIAAYTRSASAEWRAFGTGLPNDVYDIAVGSEEKLIVASPGQPPEDRPGAPVEAGVWEWNGSQWAQTEGNTVGAHAVALDAQYNVYTANNTGHLKIQPLSNGPFLEMGVYQDFTNDLENWTIYVEDLVVDGKGQLWGAPYGHNGNDGKDHGALSLWAPASFYRRLTTSGGWTRYRYPPLPNMWDAPTDVVAGTYDGLYAIWGEYPSVLYFFNGVDYNSQWTKLASLPATLALKHLVWADGKLYATGRLSDGAWRFERYDPGTDSWTELANPPIASVVTPSLSWAWDGRDHIYMLPADATTTFARYSLSTNAWETLPAPSGFTISHGPAMARVGGYVYVYGTPDTGTDNLFRYGTFPASDQRLTIDRTAFVVPDTATDFNWTNLDAAAGTYRFRADVDTANAWVGRSGANWQPGVAGATPLTTAQADFVAPGLGVYRLGAASQLAAGYYHYKATAHVYPSQDACTECAGGGLTWGVDAFATVREAVESGAARVLVHPGRYPQTFYLASGVSVMGFGAESTIIEPPTGTGGTLVAAEGTAGATLARLTLAGRAGWQGFAAEGGALGLNLTRTIIRGFDTGVHVQGGSQVAVVNNTLVGNTNGLIAEGTNPVNVRNTIFAYSTGTGLQYGASPTSLSNTYNGFWSNGTDISRGGQPDVSRGSLFVNPRFRDLAGNDLRLREDSPLIDSGAPGDLTLPGAGMRVDIGYAEYGAAGFYVSQDYSEAALNDGLIWGLDAFNAIQPALDAAAAAMHDLQGALPDGGYSVGVDSGTYTERVSVPSHVRLVGSGAEVTTLDAGGTGSAVTFDGVIDAGLDNFTVQNAGANGVEIKGGTSGITVQRNLIANNASHGVSLAGKSSAQVTFNTFVNSGGSAIVAAGAGTWVDVRNNILDSNAYGLQALASAQVFNSYNLLHDTSDALVTPGEGTVTADPAFASGTHYVPSATSLAIDAAEPWAEVPLAGGTRADMGYKELIACPLTLVFGPEIDSTVTGNSGVAKVELGVVAVSDATQPVTATLPTTTWQTLTPAQTGQALYTWSQSVSEATTGLYRVYSRATDEAGNTESERDWYEGAFVVDDTAPAVTWRNSLPSTIDAAAVLAAVDVAGTVSTGTGTRDDVKQVSFSVTPLSAAATVYPAENGQAWIPLPVAGTYTISAVAVDEAGNETHQDATVTVNSSSSVATVTDPSDGSAVSSTDITLHGYARFSGTGSHAITVTVDGATVQATLADPTAALSAWSAPMTLPAVEDSNTVTVTPSVGGTQGTVTTLHVALDTTAPTLSITTPTAGSTVSNTLTFTGIASDAGAGLLGVEVSMDGGYTWRRAVVDNGA